MRTYLTFYLLIIFSLRMIKEYYSLRNIIKCLLHCLLLKITSYSTK